VRCRSAGDQQRRPGSGQHQWYPDRADGGESPRADVHAVRGAALPPQQRGQRPPHQHQRAGVGAQLTKAALAIAAESGARTVDLTSRPAREAARLTARGEQDRAEEMARRIAPRGALVAVTVA